MSLCSESLFWGCSLSSSWLLGVQPPFFAVHSFVFKSAFCGDLLISFGQSHMRWSGLLHPKQLLFFCWYSLTALVKQMIFSIGWSVPPDPPDALTSSSAEDSVSPSPSCFTLESTSPSSFPMVAAQVVKVCCPSVYVRGISSLGFWEHVAFNPLVIAVFGGRGSLASALLSCFCVARSRLEQPAGFSLSTLWTSICQYWGLRPSQKQSCFIFSMCFGAESFLDTPTGVSGPAVTCTPQIQLHSFPIPAWGDRAPCWGCWMSLWHHNVHTMSAKCHSGLHLHLNS